MRSRFVSEESMDNILGCLGTPKTVLQVAREVGLATASVRGALSWARENAMALPVGRDVETGAKLWQRTPKEAP